MLENPLILQNRCFRKRGLRVSHKMFFEKYSTCAGLLRRCNIIFAPDPA